MNKETLFEEAANKIANYYERHWDTTVYFDTEEDFKTAVKENKELPFPLFVLYISNVEVKKEDDNVIVYLPICYFYDPSLSLSFVKESLIKSSPKRFKKCTIKKLSPSLLKKVSTEDMTYIAYVLEISL